MTDATERNRMRDLVKRLAEGLDWAMTWVDLEYDREASNVDPEWADDYDSARLALNDARNLKRSCQMTCPKCGEPIVLTSRGKGVVRHICYKCGWKSS